MAYAPPAPVPPSAPPAARRRRVAVQFVDSPAIPSGPGAEASLQANGAGPWSDLAAAYPGISLSPMFTTLGADDLRLLAARAERRDPTYHAPNFLRCYFVDAPAGTDYAGLAHELAGWPTVERAYVSGYAAPAYAPPTALAMHNPQRGSQGYRQGADKGIGADLVMARQGGRGQGQRFIDVETDWMVELRSGAWVLTHEDLKGTPLDPAAPQGALEGTDDARQHGTKVLGIVCARNNTIGILGIASDVASVGLASYKRTVVSDMAVSTLSENIPDAITTAASVLAFGDVLLLEVEIRKDDRSLWTPVEADWHNYQAVRLATALGIVVVEAGSNGNDFDTALALDDYTDDKGERVFDRSVRDSMAVLVSAATSSVPHTRIAYAPYGRRIDCHAWGQVVYTCDTSASAPYAYFNKTSAATAIVAGAALVVQAHTQTRYGLRLGPADMRHVLSTYGTKPDPDPTAYGAPVTSLIGLMPDLVKIFDNLSDDLPHIPFVYMRDFVGDDGLPHDAATLWKSPDVILNSSPLPAATTPDAAFGESSLTADDIGLSTPAVSGQDNFAYVRVRNRGGADAADVHVRIHWSRPTTLMTPRLWKDNVVGTVVIPNVPTGNLLTVSDPILWPAADVPPSGHYCFVAMLAVGAPPSAPPDDFGSMDTFRDFVRHNRDVAWRNINVIDGGWRDAVEPIALEFIAPGGPEDGAPMGIEVLPELPPTARVGLEAPVAYLAAVLPGKAFIADAERRVGIVDLSPYKVSRFPAWSFPADADLPMRLRIDLARVPRRRPFQITVRQTWRGEPLGGVTWRFV